MVDSTREICDVYQTSLRTLGNRFVDDFPEDGGYGTEDLIRKLIESKKTTFKLLSIYLLKEWKSVMATLPNASHSRFHQRHTIPIIVKFQLKY